jgi:hypothetical protein
MEETQERVPMLQPIKQIAFREGRRKRRRFRALSGAERIGVERRRPRRRLLSPAPRIQCRGVHFTSAIGISSTKSVTHTTTHTREVAEQTESPLKYFSARSALCDAHAPCARAPGKQSAHREPVEPRASTRDSTGSQRAACPRGLARQPRATASWTRTAACWKCRSAFRSGGRLSRH